MRRNTENPSSNLGDSYHQTPGDTSEGRWLTVLFSLIGCVLGAASFVVYIKCRAMTALLAALSILDLAYAYIEISHLYIRKYWFRYHRRLAVMLSLSAYWIIAFLLVICINHHILSLSFTWQLAWVPFFLMPPAIVLALAVYCMIHIIGG